MQIDATGRSCAYQRPVPADALVLHLPSNPGTAAVLLGLPPQLSEHQRAAYDLLVRQTQG